MRICIAFDAECTILFCNTTNDCGVGSNCRQWSSAVSSQPVAEGLAAIVCTRSACTPSRFSRIQKLTVLAAKEMKERNAQQCVLTDLLSGVLRPM
jgi:hypothetical protein